MNISRRVISAVFILFALYMIRADFILYTTQRAHTGEDFWEYYTAAWLVRGNQSLDLYEAAGKDVDPAEEDPAPNSIFEQAAHAHGVLFTHSFDYPPTLADLLSPITFLSPSAALMSWYLLNAAALVCAGLLFARTTGMHLIGYAAPIILFLCIFPVTTDCLIYAQIPIVLLFLIVTGISLYVRGKTLAAALLFALAGAIKFTPFIVIIPLLAWRDWKTLRALALWSLGIFAVLLVVNGPGSLNLYFLHEMPKVATKWIDPGNRSLDTLIEALWSRSASGAPVAGSVLAGRLVSALVVCCAGCLGWMKRIETLDVAGKVEIIAIFLLLSCCVAPLSWPHAYVLSAPALVIIGQRIWEGRLPLPDAVVSLLFLLSMSIIRLQSQGWLTAPLGITLALMGLVRLRGERRLHIQTAIRFSSDPDISPL
jgi:Glycosyltransferase family 87